MLAPLMLAPWILHTHWLVKDQSEIKLSIYILGICMHVFEEFYRWMDDKLPKYFHSTHVSKLIGLRLGRKKCDASVNIF